MRSGHVVADGLGHILSADDGLGAIMHTEVASLIGRGVLDITAPADRGECGECLARLMADRTPFQITKRFLREDGSLVWVSNTVSLAGGGRDGDLIVATVAPVPPPVTERAPARLLDSARVLAELQDHSTSLFEPALLSHTGWSAVLAAYIAEAEGRAVTIAALARSLRISMAQAERWIAALIRGGMIEIETREMDPYAPKSFRLTDAAHRRLEGHLARVGARIDGKRPKVATS